MFSMGTIASPLASRSTLMHRIPRTAASRFGDTCPWASTIFSPSSTVIAVLLRVYLRRGQSTLCAKIDLQQPVRPGETLWLQFSPHHLHYFDRDGKRL
jgi:hypothetical protein